MRLSRATTWGNTSNPLHSSPPRSGQRQSQARPASSSISQIHPSHYPWHRQHTGSVLLPLLFPAPDRKYVFFDTSKRILCSCAYKLKVGLCSCAYKLKVGRCIQKIWQPSHSFARSGRAVIEGPQVPLDDESQRGGGGGGAEQARLAACAEFTWLLSHGTPALCG